MPIDVATFRKTMGLFPGAVTLITTGEGDLRRGITATAVCSVSDDPPSLLVCVNRSTGTCKEIARSGRFSVQLLGQDHADVAMTFAGADGKTGADKYCHRQLGPVPRRTTPAWRCAGQCVLQGDRNDRRRQPFDLCGLYRRCRLQSG